MALTVTISDAAKAAAADRMAGGTSLLQAKYVVFVDSAATPVRFRAGSNAVAKVAGVASVTATATGTCPAGVTTPIGAGTIGAYANVLAFVIGDVGAYHIDSAADADALCSGVSTTFLNYVIARVTGTGAGADVIAVTAGDSVQANPITLTF